MQDTATCALEALNAPKPKTVQENSKGGVAGSFR